MCCIVNVHKWYFITKGHVLMRPIHRLVLVFSFSLFLSSGACALELANQSSNVFKFQQKLATKGNASAEYRLACMYEFGAGIEQNLELAQHWYAQASSAGIGAAGDRMTYLSVRQQGYDEKKNSVWLDGIKKAAKESNGDAMFLLAQLYRQGLGVKKDLGKAMEMLDQVSLLGAADVEKEMTLIQQEIAASNTAKKNAARERKMDLARRAKQTTAPQVEQPQVEQQAKSEKAIMAAKRQRYEKAMMKLKREQQQIDEQQAWAEGGDKNGQFHPGQ